MSSSTLDRYAVHVLCVSFALTLAYYVFLSVLPGRGGDFFLRLAESKYFWMGINPYNVYVGAHPGVDGIGQPNAYSFVSYIFLTPLTIFDAGPFSAFLFAFLDISAFIVALYVMRSEHVFSPIAFAVTLMILMLSVFFLQHVWTLNYNIIVAAALLTAVWAARKNRLALFLISSFFVGLKPTIFIPFFILLIFRGYWRQAISLGLLQIFALLFACYQMGVVPTAYFAQIVETTEKWTDISNYGILSIIVFVGWNPSVIVSILASALVMALAVWRFDGNLLSDYALCVLVALSLFYNHVHAWVIVFPLLAVWIKFCLEGKEPMWVGVVIVLFLIVPRLMSMYPEGFRDTLVLFHNYIRFGALALGAWYFLRRPVRSSY